MRTPVWTPAGHRLLGCVPIAGVRLVRPLMLVTNPARTLSGAAQKFMQEVHCSSLRGVSFSFCLAIIRERHLDRVQDHVHLSRVQGRCAARLCSAMKAHYAVSSARLDPAYSTLLV